MAKKVSRRNIRGKDLREFPQAALRVGDLRSRPELDDVGLRHAEVTTAAMAGISWRVGGSRRRGGMSRGQLAHVVLDMQAAAEQELDARQFERDEAARAQSNDPLGGWSEHDQHVVDPEIPSTIGLEEPRWQEASGDDLGRVSLGGYVESPNNSPVS